jgi:hypothetical protein
MSLTIALQNTGNTDQLITLFNNGGSSASTFVNANDTSNTVIITFPISTSIPTPQDVTLAPTSYYNAIFNPSTNLTLVGFSNGIVIQILYLGTYYSISVPLSGGLTLTQVNTLVTNAIRTNIYYSRPNANFQFSIENVSGINYLKPNLFDDYIDSSIFQYYDIQITTSNSTYLTSFPYDQVITDNQNSSAINLSTYPNTSFDSSGWHTIQCTGLTSSSDFVAISFYDSYMFAGYSGTIQVQLTQTLGQNFDLFDGFSTQTILGSTTSIQTFSVLSLTSLQFNLSTGGVAPPYNGQIKVRAFPDATSLSVSVNSFGLQTAINSYLQGNPNVTAKTTASGVGITEILNSVIGNSYKVTSLYIWSINPNQLTQSVTYGTIDANGNIFEQELDIVIDPFAQNSVTYRTNGMNDFIIDSNAIIQFILKAESAVNMKFEYEKNGSDEIKLAEIGFGELLSEQYDEKSQIDAQLADDFDTFYLKQ